MTLPPFNNARGSASTLQLAPPFGFSDVTMSVLPLRADFNRLQSFCNSYLNHTDDHLVFQPLVPYVYMILLNYGKMSVEQENMGWVSQHEVAFSIPLRFSTLKNGVPQRTDWAFNSPFIFVDNELSMTTGREVYGWPKKLAQLDYAPANWVDNPHADRQVFQLSPYGSIKATDKKKSSPLLTVYQKDIQRLTDLPLNPSALVAPVADLPSMMLSASRIGLDVFQTAMGVMMPTDGARQSFPDLLNPAWYASLYNPQNLARLCNPGAWSESIRNLLWSVVPRASANTVNLKQFRDASGSSTVCYQAVTNAAMKLQNVAGGGLLGPQNMALNQIDGGYYIDVHNSDQLPIVEALGLQVNQQLETRHGRTSRLSPVCPFWMKVDMHYARGDVLLWRSRSGDWKTTDGLQRLANPDATPAKKETTQHSATSNDQSAAAKTGTDTPPASDSNFGRIKRDAITPLPNNYNSALGQGNAARAILKIAPDTTIRVLPLLATESNLSTFVSEYLNVPGQARFDNWGSQIYMVITNFSINRSNPFSTDESVPDREVNILVPVKSYSWYEDHEYDLTSHEGRQKRDSEKLLGTAVVAPFTFVNDDQVAIVRNEVDGAPTLRSHLNSPQNNWMETDGPASLHSQGLFETSALVLPELGVGAGASRETLLKIETGENNNDGDSNQQRQNLRSWGQALVDSLARKYAQRGVRSEQQTSNEAFRFVRALALEMLAGKLPLTSFTLKQFRDAWEPDKACYQGLILGRRRIKKLHSVCEIEEPLLVTMARYPTQPIAKLLGLKTMSSKVTRHGIVDYLKPIRPFWIHADISITPSETVSERAGHEQWLQLQNPPQLTGWQSVTLAELQNHLGTGDLHDHGVHVSYLIKNGDQWLRREHNLDTVDMAELDALQRSNRLDQLSVLSRNYPRSIMAHVPTLNHLDRVAVDSPGALLDSKQGVDEEAGQPLWTTLTLGKLAGCIGEIDPATVIDALLSRQWGFKTSARQEIHKADYVVPTSALGAAFTEQLFPDAECERTFWPQSDDQLTQSENERAGTAWRLRENILNTVDAGIAESKEFEKSIKTTMPKWFNREANDSPAEWSGSQWEQLASALGKIVDAAHDKVSWSEIIRPLDQSARKATQMHEQLAASEQRNKDVDMKDEAAISKLLAARMQKVMGG